MAIGQTICRHCSATVPQASRFCPRCGVKRVAPPPLRPLNTIAIVFNGLAIPVSLLAAVSPAASAFVLFGIMAPAVVAWAVLLHRWWRRLPERAARTTPGRAVGFSFIPIFHIYWGFVAWRGLAIDLNAHMDALGIVGLKVSERLALVFVISGIVSLAVMFVPPLSILVSIVNWILYAKLVVGLTRACEAIDAARAEQPVRGSA